MADNNGVLMDEHGFKSLQTQTSPQHTLIWPLQLMFPLMSCQRQTRQMVIMVRNPSTSNVVLGHFWYTNF